MKKNVNYLVAAQYKPFLKHYINFCEWLHQNQYANDISLQRFVDLYSSWKKNKFFPFKFLFTKKFFNHSKYKKIVVAKQSQEVDNPITMSQVLKDVIKRVLKLCVNQIKVAFLAKTIWNVYKEGKSRNNSEPKTWWYNISGRLKKLPRYGKYNLAVITPGDIVYESEGFGGLTGHIGIIEGIFYNFEFGSFYLRGLEAIHPFGICESVWDDERIDSRGVTFLRNNEVDKERAENILKYIRERLGQEYCLRLSSGLDDGKWYCSEIVWAAHKKAGTEILPQDDFFSNLKDLKEGVNFAFQQISKKNEPTELKIPQPIGIIDLLCISAGMVTPHQIFISPKFKKIKIEKL